MKIEIKSRFDGKLLFAHEVENNTLKITLEAAVKARANLARASLVGANLVGANLARASLDGANLAGAYLAGAYLTNGEKLKGKRPILQLGPLGSRSSYLIAYFTDKGVMIRAGCFFGTLDTFAEQCTLKHGDNQHGREYGAAIALIKAHAEIWP